VFVLSGRFKTSLAVVWLALGAAVVVIVPAQSNQQRKRPAKVIDAKRPVPPVSSEQEKPGITKTEALEPEVVRVDTDLVNTLFTAVDKDHHFITTLRPEDIRIFENGAEQRISTFERETNRPVSLAILIDTSESQREVLGDEKRTAREFVDSVLRPGKDRAAVVSFTGVAKIEQVLTGDPVKLRKGIERVKFQVSPVSAMRAELNEPPLPPDQDPTGYTGVWDSIWVTVEDVLSKTSEDGRRAIILLSDGDDTSSRISKNDAIDFAVKTDVVVYAIGIRDQNFPEGKLDSGALRKVSDRTGGRLFLPKDEADLRTAFSQIEQELRSQYVVAYSPINKARDGSYRQIKIEILNPELRKHKLRLSYRAGYYAKSRTN
jgi:Ca-activated chloride channel homolog